MVAADQEKSNDFIAFVSYAHPDARWARWVHHQIETFRLPRQLAKAGDGRRVGRLFLDRSELATSIDLSARIQEAMDRSANLLLVCSPAARRSRWVNEEVRRFRVAGKADRIFCLIVAGDPASPGDDGCFPPALLEPIDGRVAHEPLAADIRPDKDRPADAKLKLIAGLLDVPFDALKRRDQARRQRWLTIIAATSLVLLAIMSVLTVAAVLSRRDAVRQRDIAQHTVTFLGALFDEARPENTGGKEISVRSMVDRASTQAVASAELRHEPEVRAYLLSTLADVYVKLHLPVAARGLLREANRDPISDQRTILYRASVEANLLLLASDYDALGRVLDRAFATMGDDRRLRDTFAPQLLFFRAQLEQQTNRPSAAERDFSEARRVSLAAVPPHGETATTALLGAALADIDNGRIDRAERRLREVVAERVRSGRPRDPDVLTAINSLGAITIKRGDPVGAERWFRRAIAVQGAVYGPASLDVALSRANLGRALVEQRRFAAARDSLLTARAEYWRQVGDRVDTLANLEDSLGLALTGLGQAPAAAAAFERGLAIARANAMAKEVELLTDLAELRCATGAPGAALPLLAQARAALAQFALPEAWRAARIENVTGGCLWRAGQRRDARAAIVHSTPIVVARWGADSLFGQAARRRLAAAGSDPR